MDLNEHIRIQYDIIVITVLIYFFTIFSTCCYLRRAQEDGKAGGEVENTFYQN